jgi:hypothetical protein
VSVAYIVAGPAAKNPVNGITAYKPFFPLIEPDLTASKTDQAGLDVQVIRTYPNRSKRLLGEELVIFPRRAGYNFAHNGEMGIYQLIVHALSQTAKTIYLEDQYLVNTVAMASNSPITEAIRKTISKDSFQKMIIAVAGTPTVQGELCQAGSRRADFMRQLGPSAAGKVAVYVYKFDKNSPYLLTRMAPS